MKYIYFFMALMVTEISFATSIPCDRTIQQEIERAQVIVVAEIKSQELNKDGVGDITFNVLKQWKGKQLKSMTVNANERFPFSLGQSGYFLIYANWTTHAEKPFWQVPWCKQIMDITYASEELTILGKPKYVYE